MASHHPQSSGLPNPTVDLHWSDFQGPIHKIFADNARRHPDRLCVEETPSPGQGSQRYSYGEINAATNIVAHHLIESGIERDDVVMIFAQRGVNLVVAIMGVLKAGATFSVIDPAYPPDRQIIYLDIARPRALIVIADLNQERIPLPRKVESYIEENLQLRTLVPGLCMGRGGYLHGEAICACDVLDPQRRLQSQEPDVLIGPDSVPSLSFTSGSEGRPKAVLGRHFSLTYYFPWMSKRFGLGPDDRFTMLSGIAHDPIQRDIFTPLFLGAQILVPAAGDIQSEKLAEWMQCHGPTVTHLTPAMGQILVGGATAEFPSLRRAFFVGDVLTKRDCRSLQRLAPNANIVNMYGSTESQRAVSFYEIRSRARDPDHLEHLGDVIPVGKGMVDVQLLVVDSSNSFRLCDPGMVGEIYVRAGGLAESYLGLPELTRSKFVTNWFVDSQKWATEDQARAGGLQEEPWRQFYHGPRDRLYRTGDLGRYTSDGDVECCGRADNQVKIRGFRIELGEIDTCLSQHPFVRENVTVVRKDKDDQPALVSYVVPDMVTWSQWCLENGIEDRDDEGDDMTALLSRFQPLHDKVRGYLRQKLPSYAIPALLIPLKRMPLNPNGKIDRPVLPFPDQAQLIAVATSRSGDQSFPTHTRTQRQLAEIWAKLLPYVDAAHAIGPQDSFFDLGGHSMLAQQLVFNIRRLWPGLSMDTSVVYRCPSLSALASEIVARQCLGQSDAAEAVDRKSGAENDDTLRAKESFDYASEARQLMSSLPPHFEAAPDVAAHGESNPITVFLTGATGFLGAYILRDLLSRRELAISVVVHVRADTPSAGLERVHQTCKAYGFWSQSWSSRISCVTGDLTKPELGMSLAEYTRLSEQIGYVIHNGAWVHWGYQYSELQPSNVKGTIEALRLCSIGRSKRFVFVSSTSVFDTPHYVELSNRTTSRGGQGIGEDDDLQGSSEGLATGYGQSKWVAERLVREAERRGLQGAIIRPGYVLGDTHTGGKSPPLQTIWHG